MINKNFYPTPLNLIEKMCEGILWNDVKTVLEPSAGKGNIVDYIVKQSKDDYYRNRPIDIDCIELEEDLRLILEGKKYKVVCDDFLKFNTYKQYDLIIMNPPFDNGELHLLKAMTLSANIICLLNAETIKNPCTNARKDLVRKLEEAGAAIEYIENAFANAERKTNVEVALIKILKKEEEYKSVIIDNLEQEEKYNEDYEKINDVVSGDYIIQAIERYNYEIKVGIKLIKEYKAALPCLYASLNDEYKTPIISLNIREGECSINDFIKCVRRKYWKALFYNNKFTKRMPSNLVSEYYNKINELIEYDFSVFNINQIIRSIDKYLGKSIEEKILSLFEELSYKCSWYDETSKNIHYYNGWKTNSAYKINKKVIIPLMGYANQSYSWNKNRLDYNYQIKNKLGDITKILDFLDCGRTIDANIDEILTLAESNYMSQNIELKYFYVTFYKKGTCHLVFKDMELLNKFNIFGSQRKGWLPPSYGKNSYEDMSQEEQQVINEFQGKEEYQKVYNNTDFYITTTQQLLLK